MLDALPEKVDKKQTIIEYGRLTNPPKRSIIRSRRKCLQISSWPVRFSLQGNGVPVAVMMIDDNPTRFSSFSVS
jgi:hypothetical protein